MKQRRDRAVRVDDRFTSERKYRHLASLLSVAYIAGMNELYEQLFDTVVEMRDLQKKFFRGQRDVIERAKSVEREVDRIIEDIRDLKNPQRKLF